MRWATALLSLAVCLPLIACNGTAAQTGAAGGGRGARGGGRGGGGGAQPVVIAKAVQKDVPVEIAAVGSVEPHSSVTIRSQVTGQLEQMFIHAGDLVDKDQLLFTIDRRPFEAALQQATANLARDQALLAQAEAQLARDTANGEYQRTAFERQAALVERGIVSNDAGQQSRAQAEASAAAVNAAKAAVESAKAQLAAQQAAVENARVQLAYCTIRSPLAGRAGDVMLKPGNLVAANTTELLTIAQVDSVFVTFALPAVHLPKVKLHMAGEKLTVLATQDESGTPAEGKLTFLDNSVDPSTDTIKLKATFDNVERHLWPGQFVRVALRLTTLLQATVVPQRALQTGQDGHFVFVVTSDQMVDQRPVLAAQRVDDHVVIEHGLQPGETVVTEGQLRLEHGTRVQLADGSGVDGREGRGTQHGGPQGGHNDDAAGRGGIVEDRSRGRSQSGR